MKNVPLLLQNALLGDEAILAEVVPKYPKASAWVWVVPYHEDHLLPTALRRPNAPQWYQARYFEVETRLVEDEIDFDDSQLLFDEKHECRTLDELDEILGRWVDDPRKFIRYRDYPKKFPF